MHCRQKFNLLSHGAGSPSFLKITIIIIIKSSEHGILALHLLLPSFVTKYKSCHFTAIKKQRDLLIPIKYIYNSLDFSNLFQMKTALFLWQLGSYICYILTLLEIKESIERDK